MNLSIVETSCVYLIQHLACMSLLDVCLLLAVCIIVSHVLFYVQISEFWEDLQK